MRIAVVCNDTRGGIQPYVALGLGLQRAGHDVRAVAPSDLAPMFSEAGIPVTALSGSIEAVLKGSNGAVERGFVSSMRFAAREIPPRIHEWTKQTLEGCEGADIVTGGVGGMVIGLAVAEKLGKPFIETHLHPVGAPTDAYPGILLPKTPRWLGSGALHLSHHLSELVLWSPFRGAMTTAREKVLGLSGKPRPASDLAVLYGFSRHVIQVPPDSRRTRHVTGYWTLPAPPDWTPPPALQAFLAQGGPVVSIGFGSMATQKPEAVTELVLGAVRNAGVRAVLLAGWGGISTLSNVADVYCANALPHDWLFPRMAAIVHHGGAGTTGAALRAGVPAIVVPFTMDQPFWGMRVAALGAGPRPIPRAKLTREGLAEALVKTVSDLPVHKRAAELGAHIRAEDGVAAAVEHFERLEPALRAA